MSAHDDELYCPSFNLAEYLMSPEKKLSFFKPFSSAKDVGARGAAIIVAPMMHAQMSIFSLVYSLYHAVFSVIDLFKAKPKKAVEDLKQAGEGLKYMFIHLISGVLSPVINLVDFLVSIIKSALPDSNRPPTIQPQM